MDQINGSVGLSGSVKVLGYIIILLGYLISGIEYFYA